MNPSVIRKQFLRNLQGIKHLIFNMNNLYLNFLFYDFVFCVVFKIYLNFYTRMSGINGFCFNWGIFTIFSLDQQIIFIRRFPNVIKIAKLLAKIFFAIPNIYKFIDLFFYLLNHKLIHFIKNKNSLRGIQNALFLRKLNDYINTII